ncbi:MAG: TonB-dependent receptor [Bacteroides sp.]|nr:TonB-dependent receptor [Bacteroides sp.]
MTNRTIISLLCVAATLPAYTQVSKEITVEREVVATLRDVSPISFTPSVNLPSVEKPTLNYSERTITARIPTMFSLLEPTAVADTIPASPWRGYAAIGYFPAFNLGASAGYRLISSRSTTLDAWLQYDGSSYKIAKDFNSYYGDYDHNVKNQSGALGLRLSHLSGGGGHLGLEVNYAIDHFNNPFSRWPFGSPVNQTVHRFGLDGLLTSKTNDLGYSIGLNYKLFSPAKGYHQHTDIRPVRENYATLSGALFATLSETSSYRLDVEAGMISWSRSGIASTIYTGWENSLISCDGQTSGLITVTPSYRYATGKFSLNLGARVDLSINADKFFHIAPDVKAALTPSDFFAVFARVGGGEHINTMGSLFALDRYIAPVFRYDYSHIPVEGEAGLRVGPFRGASLTLSAAYASANGWLMPYSIDLGTTVMQAHDMRGWQFKAGLEYNFRNLANLAITATANPQDKDDITKGYYLDRDRARYTLDAELTLHPMSQLDLMLGYELRACRWMNHLYVRSLQYCGTRSAEGYSNLTSIFDYVQALPNLANLRAGASWRCTPAFTVFARLENILNRNTPSYSLIPGQGFKGLVGVAYKF